MDKLFRKKWISLILHIIFCSSIRRRTISKYKEVFRMGKDIDHLILDVDDLVFDNTEIIHSDR